MFLVVVVVGITIWNVYSSLSKNDLCRFINIPVSQEIPEIYHVVPNAFELTTIKLVNIFYFLEHNKLH